MNTSAPIYTASSLDTLTRFDERLRQWSLAKGAVEFAFPALIDRATLDTAGYPVAFPHLLLGTCCAIDPAHPSECRPTDWSLSPAVCYHAYAHLAGHTLDSGQLLAARGPCFRNEIAAELSHGRRQIEFQMRELILVGPPDWIEAQLSGVHEEIAAFGLPGQWKTASDPFFLPTARGKARMQQLAETKHEFCLADGLAIASTNRHRDFFGRRFDISLPDGSTAHSACVAFGLDRWTSNL